MNSFIINIFANLLRFFIFSICLILFMNISKSTSQIYFNLKKKEFIDYRDIEIGFFGHSQMRGGIDSDLVSNHLGKRVENFAEGGSPLFFSIKQIEHLIDKNPNVKIVIEIGLNDLDSRGIVRNYRWEGDETSSFKEILRESFYLLSFNEIKYFFDSPKKFKVFQFMLNSILFPINFVEGDEINFSGLNKSQSNIDLFKNYLDKYSNDDLDEYIEKQFNYLNNLIKKYPENKFLIITIPEHQISIDEYDNLHKFNYYLKPILESKNVDYKSYIGLFKEDSLFENFNHITYEGAKIFSSILIKDNLDFFK